MNKVAFSGRNVSISYIWEWYQGTEKALRTERKRVLDSLISHSHIENVFIGMTREDVYGYFEEHNRERDGFHQNHRTESELFL